jgi:hypothetical protein
MCSFLFNLTTGEKYTHLAQENVKFMLTREVLARTSSTRSIKHLFDAHPDVVDQLL